MKNTKMNKSSYVIGLLTFAIVILIIWAYRMIMTTTYFKGALNF